MCDSTFAFGQRGSHFFQCPSKTDYARLPQKLAKLLSSSQMKQVHHITLGYEDSFLLAWRDTCNQDRIDFAGLPAELVAFLYPRNPQGQWSRNVPKIRCVLGSYNDSWFVDDGNAYSWMNLPPKLLTVLQAKIQDGDWMDRPRIVALGAGSNFVLLTDKHDAFWDLNQYRTVANVLQRANSERDGISAIHKLILHPYRYDSFITHSQTAVFNYGNLPPPSIASIDAMVEPIKKDTNDAKLKPLARNSSLSQTGSSPRPSVLQQRALMKREWSQHHQKFSAQAKGMKVSLSLSVSVGGITKLLGRRS